MKKVISPQAFVRHAVVKDVRTGGCSRAQGTVRSGSEKRSEELKREDS